MFPLDDTIAAIASPAGGAIRGIVRLSGPRSIGCVQTHFEPLTYQPSLGEVPRAMVVAGHFSTGQLHSKLPCDVYLWPTLASFTRQPMAEVHTLGSPPLLQLVLQSLCHDGARAAEPGEFTLRAFLSGRLDLTQAEAVLGVIDAANRTQLDTALVQLAGGISRPMTRIRNELLELLAHVEAGLDFVEDDIEFIPFQELDRQLARSATAIAGLIEQMDVRTDATQGVRVVLYGLPNTGKSSLFNALLDDLGQTHRAIVSSQSGTTRDYVRAIVDLDGISFEIVDTAGIELNLPIAAPMHAAQQMSVNTQANADIRLLCIDGSRSPLDWERDQIHKPEPSPQIVVVTKSDLAGKANEIPGALVTSSRTGRGLPDLRHAIHKAATTSVPTSVVSSTAARCKQSLQSAASALDRARAIHQCAHGDELLAVELRSALEELGKTVGAIYTDDLLDRIFSRFCIGK